MTPYEELESALELARHACAQLSGKHLMSSAMSSAIGTITDAVEQLGFAIEDLPREIVREGGWECVECEHYKTEIDREPYGDRMVTRVEYQCVAKDHALCPIVLSTGFGAKRGGDSTEKTVRDS